MNSDPRIAIVEAVCDVEQSEQPFGKRWRQEEVVLSAEHLAALPAHGKRAQALSEEEGAERIRSEARMAHKKATGPKAQKKVTRYTYDEVKEPCTPETEHMPLLPAEEQVVTLPMVNGWCCGSLTGPWEGRTIAAIVGGF